MLNFTSLMGLFNKSFKELIFLTLILLNLFSMSEIDFTRDKMNELPSSKISRFKSKISENTKSSNTLFRSVNFKTA